MVDIQVMVRLFLPGRHLCICNIRSMVKGQHHVDEADV